MQTKAYFVEQRAAARIPTEVGEFRLCYYQNNLDEKEHLAVVLGDVYGRSDVLVRIHSECFTGDVLGSLRCDCGPQLERAMQMIAAEGAGVILYLRQEGRGIGLLDKLRAYNLQDEGYDTVDANLMLGHQPDARNYHVAALILQDLQVQSLRLLTNNPAKMEELQSLGLQVKERVPVPLAVNPENEVYLQTKVEKMRHLLDLGASPYKNGTAVSTIFPTIIPRNGRPHITLTYAQSLDGSIAVQRGEQTAISGLPSLKMTHQLRAQHDAILVGIGTVLADDPSLTVRLVAGPQPQPIIVDSRLKTPVDARLLAHPKPPIILTTHAAHPVRMRNLESAGAVVVRGAATPAGQVQLTAAMATLVQLGLHSVMVEGGARILTAFLTAQLVDSMVITIAPTLLGGLNAITHLNGHGAPRLQNPRMVQLGEDIVVSGQVVWPSQVSA